MCISVVFVHQRGLARAAGAHDRDEVPARDVETYAIEGLNDLVAKSIRLVKVVNGNDSVGSSCIHVVSVLSSIGIPKARNDHHRDRRGVQY